MNIKKNIKVSIVVPVYNVEKYLHQCIGSILNQKLKDIELIVVNDGSTDSSLSICKEFEKKDDRVIVINKRNGGTGTAYNAGILKACGEYIGFIDADDWIESSMHDRLYKLAKKTDADIVRCDYFKYDSAQKRPSTVFPHGNAKLSSIYPQNKVFSVKDAPLLLSQRMVAWSGIFNSKLIKNMKFTKTPAATYQDFVFMFEAFIKAKRIVLCYDKLVHYRMENHRCTATKNPGKTNAVYLIKQINKVKNFLDDNNLLVKYSEEFYYNVTQILSSFWYSIKPDIRNKFYNDILALYKELPPKFKYKYFEKGFRIFVQLVLKDKKTLFLSACYNGLIKSKK
ncbi:glycosyltransferase family 2 protein [Elusimicrobiota bacterium]